MSIQGSGKNARIVIVRRIGCKISAESIQNLLDKTGASFADIIFVEDVSELDDLELADSVVLILIDQDGLDDPVNDEVAGTCIDQGADVIAVFGDGVAYQGMHPIAEKCGNQCTWSAEDLLDKICNPKTAKPTAPTGAKPERDREKPVKCS